MSRIENAPEAAPDKDFHGVTDREGENRGEGEGHAPTYRQAGIWQYLFQTHSGTLSMSLTYPTPNLEEAYALAREETSKPFTLTPILQGAQPVEGALKGGNDDEEADIFDP